MVKINFDYIRNKVGVSYLKLFDNKPKKILIFSPQRTFSNYFETFLIKNFYLEVINSTDYVRDYNNILHKHINNFSKKKFKKYNNKNYIFFILYKNSNLWLKSIKKNDMDFFNQFLIHHKIKIRKNDKYKLKKYHKNWYKNWIKLHKYFNNVELINHKQTLKHDSNLSLFEYLKKKYKLIDKGKMKIPRKIRRSKKFNKIKYLKNIKIKDDDYGKIFKLI